MKSNVAMHAAVIVVAMVGGLGSSASAQVTFEWATVGNPGNAADPLNSGSIPGIGTVGYVYRIAKHELTNAQYAEFLNAVAKADPNELYNAHMGSDVWGGITQSGVSGDFMYNVKSNMGNKPVVFVSFFDAMRFVNWLHNGQPSGAQNETTTEDGVYAISDGLSETRAANAEYFIPTRNEWYKAAYHQPSADGGDLDDYWLYPTASNSVPTLATANATGDISNPGTNVVNYEYGADWNGQDGNATTVGSAGPLSESYYGTSDQGGNVWEWNESVISVSFRGSPGGAWNTSENWLRSSSQNMNLASTHVTNIGFRVASPVAAVCGDGMVGGSEECDDNGIADGDGCSSTCTVESGYTCDASEPSVCTDDNECIGQGSGHNCDVNAACSNTPGSFTCTCNSGYSGDGMACTDDNECIGQGTGHNCTINGSCSNTPGSFICVCDTGYAGATCDQCAPDYYNYPNCIFCQASTTCSGNGACNSSGGCNCDSGWIGTDCATPAPPDLCNGQQKLTASVPVSGARFGNKVALDGDTAVIGASWESCPAGSSCGAIYVFRFNGTSWIEQQRLTASDAAQNDFFGDSVSISGDTIVAGSFLDDCTAGGDCGSAYVFRFNGTSWVEEQKLTASDAASSTRFGNDISVNSDTVVVASVWADGAAAQSGAAYVFRYDASQTICGLKWCEEQKLMASDGASGDEFAHVAMSGYTIVVGAHAPDCSAGSDCGAAYVFRHDVSQTICGLKWCEEQKLTASDAAAVDHFGQWVALDGSTAVMGAPLDNDQGTDSGSAYVFVRSGGVWTQQQKLTASDGAAGDWFGWSVSVHGNTAMIGAPQNDDGGSDSGSAYIFVRNGTTWTQRNKLTASDAAAGDVFGSSVAISCGFAFAGASGNDDAGGDSGSAYTFSCALPIPDDLLPDTSAADKTRFVSFVVPGAPTTPTCETALRVKLVSLHHVEPPYTGGASVPFTSFEGEVRWVGLPAQYIESTASGTPFYASFLQCTPHYQDWSTVGLLHVTGSAIVPSSIYDVENVAASCMGAEAGCTAVSEPLEVATTRWGDVEQPYNPPNPTAQPDVGDISALVNKFRSAAGAPIKARALLAGDDAFGNINLSPDLSFNHISACVDAFRGKPYPYTIQSCP